MEMIECACGCGKLRSRYDKRGRERKYICGHAMRGKKHSEETKRKMRETHRRVTWKGDKATAHSARSRARRQYDAPKGRDIHHIDGNPWNNEPDNIEFLARRKHMIKDGRMELLKKYRPKN